jgi:signal transduction histidine kinase
MSTVKNMRRIRPYLASTAITLVATALRYALAPFLGDRFPLLTYVPAVEIIAYFFGFRPAMISIGLSLVLARVLFIKPLHPLLFPPPESVVFSSLFILFSASLSMLMENLRVSRAAAESNAALARLRLERLEEEIAARQLERNWSDSVLASIGDGVIAADKEGKVTYTNLLAEHLTGWTAREAVNQSLNRVFYTLEGSGYTLLSATDGRMIPVEHSISIIRGTGGEEIGKVVVFRDVSERRKSEEALQASEMRMHASLMAAGAASWEWNQQSDEIVCSAEFLELTGLSAAGTYLGFPAFLEAIHELDRLPLRDELASAARRGVEFRLEYRLLRSGEIRWIALMGRLASPGRMAGILVDVTERRRLEEKLRDAAKQESLGVLSAGIAHDFNNLLTSILGYASLLKTEFPPESKASGYAQGIEESGKRAAELTRQMLAYSGQGRFSVEVCSVTARVQNTVSELRSSLETHITFELKLTDDLPKVRADPYQLDQVTSGLLINALEAIGLQPGTVRVATFQQSVDSVKAPFIEVPGGQYVVVEVSDTGCGMDEMTRRRIFDPFFTTKFTGRGLGLAAVLGIVRGHGGAIRVESELGAGSTFQVFWPAVLTKIAHGV